MYAAVPRIIPTPVIIAGVVIVGDCDTLGDIAPGGSIAFASPKSSTFTVPSGRTLMFAGLRSRWMIPCSCAASSASAICLAIGSASSTGIAPRAMRCDEVVALDEFHHQRTHTVRFFEAVDVRDVRMIERGERLRLACEPGESVGIARERIRQDLQRDIAIELRVAGAIHLAHAAFANLRGDFVDAEANAGGEGQLWRDYMGVGPRGADRSCLINGLAFSEK